MFSPRKEMAVTRARQVISDLEIAEPDEIDIERIAFFFGVGVQYQQMDGMDGRIVRNGEKALISVRDSIE